jgi:hypothetical protein
MPEKPGPTKADKLASSLPPYLKNEYKNILAESILVLQEMTRLLNGSF